MWVQVGKISAGVLSVGIIVGAAVLLRPEAPSMAPQQHDATLPYLTPAQTAELDPTTRALIDDAAATTRSHSVDPEAWKRLGMALQANKFALHAQAAYAEAIRLAPNDAQARYLHAMTHDELGDLEGALRVMTDAARLAPSEPATHWRKGLFELDLGAFDAAESSFSRALELDESSQPARLGLARLHLVHGQPAEAVALIEPIAQEQGPHQSYAYQLLGAAWRRMGLHEEANAAAQRSAAGHNQWQGPWDLEVAQYCSLPAVQMDVARNISRQGNLEHAERMLRRLAEHRPNDPSALTYLAICYREHLRFDDSLALLNNALALRPDSYFVQAQLGLTLLAQSSQRDSDRHALLRQSLQRFDQALKTNPSLVTGHGLRGDVLAQLGQIDAAAEAYHHAAELDGVGIAWLRRAGTMYMRHDRWDDAIDVLRRLSTLTPNDTEALLMLGRAYQNAGHVGAARDTFLRGAELAPGDERFARAAEQVMTDASSQEGR